MARMAEELQAEGDQEAVSVELPAPAGWKKFISKKAGTPRRNEIAFISPTGEEIRYKKQLDRYLRSHPGGPSSSEFDWGYGDTPRRSARLSEKAKEIAEGEPSKKQGTHLSTKRGTKKKKEDRDSDSEEYSPEKKRPKKREKHSTPQKGTKRKIISVDTEIGDEDPEKCKLDTKAPESVEDAEMKDAEDVSVEEKGESSSAKAILEDSIAKVDLKDECEHETDGLVAEVKCKVPVSVKIATEEPASVDVLDVKDPAVGSIKRIEEVTPKLDSDDGAKLKRNDVDADIEDEAQESAKFVTQALESTEDSDTKDVAKVDTNDDVDAEMKDEVPISDNIAIQVLNSVEDFETKNVTEVGSNDDLDVAMNDGVPETEHMATQTLKCTEDSDTKKFAKVDSNDDIDAEVKNVGLKSESIATEAIKRAEDSNTKIDEEVKNGAPESEKMAAEASKEPFEENLHKMEEDTDKTLLNKNHKGEQVSPSKAIPNANYRDLKSPEKAAAIV